MILLLLPMAAGAQKITLGSTTTKDGGEYNGEMSAGKPHGKGKTTYKNGNTYEGEYDKGKRQQTSNAGGLNTGGAKEQSGWG